MSSKLETKQHQQHKQAFNQKMEKIPQSIIEACSSNQIIGIQLQLLVILYCFKEVPLPSKQLCETEKKE